MLQAAVRGDKSSKATRQGTGAYSSQEEEEEAKPDLQAMQGMETQHHGPTSELMKARTFLDRLLEEVKIFHERFSFQNWRVDRLRDWRDDLVKDVENQYQKAMRKIEWQGKRNTHNESYMQEQEQLIMSLKQEVRDVKQEVKDVKHGSKDVKQELKDFKQQLKDARQRLKIVKTYYTTLQSRYNYNVMRLPRQHRKKMNSIAEEEEAEN